MKTPFRFSQRPVPLVFAAQVFTDVGARAFYLLGAVRLALGLAVCVILTSASAGAQPCTLYVRAGFVPAPGVIANGSSPSRALPSIRDAAMQLTNPGVVVCVGPGVYVESNISPVRSGIETHPIVFRADSSGQSTQDPPGQVRVVPPPGSTAAAGFRVLGQRHIVIEGFVLDGFTDPAIQVRSAVGTPGNSGHIVIRNNRIRAVGRTGIDVTAEGVIVIEGNRVDGAGGSGISVQTCMGAPAFGDASAMIQPRCRGGPSEEVQPTIRWNRVENCISHGLFVEDAIDGLIENNEIYDSGGSGIVLRHARGVVVQYNLVHRMGDQGLTVRSAAGIPGNSADLTILANEFIQMENGTGLDIAAEGMILLRGNHVEGAGGSGVSVQSCMGAPEYDDPTLTPNLRCRGGPGEPLEVVADTNRVIGSGSQGFFVKDSFGGAIENNEILDSGGTGIVLWHVREFRVTDNQVRRTGDQGLTVRSAVGISGNSSDLTIRNNRFVRMVRTGIDIVAEGMIVLEENHVVGAAVAGGSGVAIQTCMGALDHDDPALNPNQRCRGGPGGPVEVIADTNRIGISRAHGLFVQDAIGGVVQNNVIFSHEMTGISLRNAPDFVVFNNLIYRNGEQGLAIGTADLPSPRAIVVNNTIYENGDWGIEIGSGNAESASEGAMVVNNIVSRNGGGQKGIGVINEAGLTTRTTCGYIAGYNIGEDEYGPKTPFNVYDVRRKPEFAGLVTGPDGILGGHLNPDGTVVDGSADDNFRLRQLGGSNPSPAVDAGYALVEEVGLLGSTAPDGRPDTGVLDAGYHYGVAVGAMPNFPLPFMPVYVRVGGSNDNNNNGKNVSAPLSTIAAGAIRARAGVTVVVGPGTYRECGIKPPPDHGRATFLADPSGELTGGAPGHVLLDVGCCSRNPVGNHCIKGNDGFNIPNACNVVVDGFHVRGAVESGIIIQSGSHGAEVRNNVTFTNDRRGIGVVNAHDVRIANNLVYDNLGGGIQVGGGVCRPGADCSVIGSRRAVVENNTCYGNGVNGILIGSGSGHSTHATVRYNILHVGRGESLPPGENGIQVGSNTTLADHIEGYTAYFNLNFEGRYGGSTPRPPSDRIDDPRFVSPAGPDGILGGSGFADDMFHLSHRATGQSSDSPAIDFSDISALLMGLSDRTTRIDLVTDQGLVDLGYHYPLSVPLAVGDCNDDGVVTVNELIRAVRIALGEMSLEHCPKADANGDGVVSVAELTMAVRQALYGLR